MNAGIDLSYLTSREISSLVSALPKIIYSLEMISLNHQMIELDSLIEVTDFYNQCLEELTSRAVVGDTDEQESDPS